jgi:hypothetical protein
MRQGFDFGYNFCIFGERMALAPILTPAPPAASGSADCLVPELRPTDPSGLTSAGQLVPDKRFPGSAEPAWHHVIHPPPTLDRQALLDPID